MDEVRQIVQSLEQALEQMEEVQELIDLADRQKSADEREIDSLRRALRRIQQPRGHKDAPHEHGSD
jgi:2-keto-4-pentenoate hydratase